MKAVVLVGGFGTRLRPLTNDVPKQMLPVVDRPMIEWVVGGLAPHGVDEVVLSLGYKPDAFIDAYPDGTCAGVEISYAVDPQPLDTAGAIRYSAEAAGIRERFLVVNGDILTDLDVSALVEFHASTGGEASIALHRVDDPSRFGVVPIDETGRVTAFVEKPPPGEAPTDLINAGFYVMEPSVLARIPTDRPVSIERETFPALVADGALYAWADGGRYWLDTGTPAQYLQAQLDLISGERGVRVDGVSARARVAVAATVTRSIVRPGAEVHASAEVRDSAVLDGAHVGDGALVVASIIGPGARVGAGAVVVESVVGRDVVIEDAARLEGIRVPEPA